MQHETQIMNPPAENYAGIQKQHSVVAELEMSSMVKKERTFTGTIWDTEHERMELQGCEYCT